MFVIPQADDARYCLFSCYALWAESDFKIVTKIVMFNLGFKNNQTATIQPAYFKMERKLLNDMQNRKRNFKYIFYLDIGAPLRDN